MYDVLARAIQRDLQPQISFFEFTMTQEKNGLMRYLYTVRWAWQTCNIESLRPGLFTLHPLRLIARKLAILILTQQNVIMDTSLGYDNSGIKIKFFPKYSSPRFTIEVLIPCLLPCASAALCICCLLLSR
jgi:hypothetical protein